MALAWGQNPDPKESPPARWGAAPKVGSEAAARVAPRGHSSQSPASDGSELSGGVGGEQGGQGWSWQEHRGGRKQETIKEKFNPGLGLAQVREPCKLSSGWDGGGFLGVWGEGEEGMWGGRPEGCLQTSSLTDLLDAPKIITTLPW